MFSKASPAAVAQASSSASRKLVASTSGTRPSFQERVKARAAAILANDANMNSITGEDHRNLLSANRIRISASSYGDVVHTRVTRLPRPAPAPSNTKASRKKQSRASPVLVPVEISETAHRDVNEVQQIGQYRHSILDTVSAKPHYKSRLNVQSNRVGPQAPPVASSSSATQRTLPANGPFVLFHTSTPSTSTRRTALHPQSSNVMASRAYSISAPRSTAAVGSSKKDGKAGTSSWQTRKAATLKAAKPVKPAKKIIYGKGGVHKSERGIKRPLGQPQLKNPDVGPASQTEDVDGETETVKQADVEEVQKAVARDLPPHLAGAEEVDGKLPAVLIARGEISAADVNVAEVKPDRDMTVNRLRKDLQRIPFSPGIQWMQDPRTGVWNFKPDQLYDIPKPEEFAYHRCPQYISPGKDEELAKLAETHGTKFTGSTSTLTKAMSQIYFALSGNRGVDLSYLSQAYSAERTDYTFGATLPAMMVIGKSPNGTMYVNADKAYDVENVLSKYGNILEKMLTTEADDFKRFLTTSPESAVPDSERHEREAYRYQKANKLIMRSQLDCYDPRLPGAGVFDIKTRAVVTIRHDRANAEANSAYMIFNERGFDSSFEREYYDLIRAAMLKYSFQARIGMMDGIFLAYHNTSQIFGFQYIPLTQIDEHLFGSTEMADQAFKLTVALLEVLLEEMTGSWPDEDISVTLKQSLPQKSRTVTAFVQPREWNGPQGTKPTQAFALKLESLLDGKEVVGPISFSKESAERQTQNWTVKYELTRTNMDAQAQQTTREKLDKVQEDIKRMMWVSLPDGKTVEDMDLERAKAMAYGDYDEDLSVTKWKTPDARIKEMRKLAQSSAAAWENRKKNWRVTDKEVYAWEPTN